MAITGKTDPTGVGSWQEVFERDLTPELKKSYERVVGYPEICLEHALIEMEVYNEIDGQNLPRVTERAMIFERYLDKRTIEIYDEDFIVGNVCSKNRGSIYYGELYNVFMKQELDHPERDPQVRHHDKHIIHEDERKILREQIFPFFEGRTFEEYLYSKADEEVAEKGFIFTASCPHIPNTGDLLVRQDAGHFFANYEKVLRKGLGGIREELEYNRKECAEAYNSFERKERLQWYDAAIRMVNAAIRHCNKFGTLAEEKAAACTDEKRKAQLLEIARVCHKVPEHPAESWHEALQSVWFTQMLILSEQINYGESFGRFDQYMYPYYKKDVIDEKNITEREALEMLEFWWIKTASFTELYDFDTALVQAGYPISQNLLVGGMLPDGTDGCNELTMACLEADMQVGLLQPEIAMRIWEGTPDEYLRKAVEVVRLGRGKPKFYGDKTAIKMMKKAYPQVSIEDCADYGVIGCVEIGLPYVTQVNSFVGLSNIGKIFELTMNNGRCACCGKQIGPMTGDPRKMESIEQFKTAFREQTFYWMEAMAKAMKVEMECHAERLQLPFTSSLIEGPIGRGRDAMQGGAWYTHYGVLVGGTANAADSFSVVDTLIYKQHKVTWDELIQACADNWEGHDELRQICINEVPKYGNDDDYADQWAAYVMDVWYDSIDYVNTKTDLKPWYGGQYTGAVLIGNGAVAMGTAVGGLPEGHIHPYPLADTWAPVQGRDVNGATAVMNSITKLPAHRFEMGTALNQRLTPAMLATDEDVTKFMNYLRAAVDKGLYHVQFNIINSEGLKKAMEQPEEYKDLLIRVASYVSYFVELDEMTQLDIINRTEKDNW